MQPRHRVERACHTNSYKDHIQGWRRAPEGDSMEVSNSHWNADLYKLTFTTYHAFATHQCTCYSTSPRKVDAVKQIMQYLKGTHDRGYVLQPSKEKWLDCYVDFAGIWNTQDSDDPNCVKSRTGYVIIFANCPILLVSKLQTKIALSATEGEYVALSQAMHDVLPMRTLLNEVAKLTSLKIDKITVLYSF